MLDVCRFRWEVFILSFTFSINGGHLAYSCIFARISSKRLLWEGFWFLFLRLISDGYEKAEEASLGYERFEAAWVNLGASDGASKC